jgi:short-subunit dehydrogenase
VALEFARRGATLAITARNEKALNELKDQGANPDSLILAYDVTDRQSNHEAVDKIKKTWGAVDIAFFNAGTAEYVDVNNFDAEIFERTISSNFLSMIYGIEAVLPLLRLSKAAQLGGMSSTVAYAGVPRAEAYGASKAATRNMLQALRVSLVHQNIDVFTVCPGFVKTPLTDKNDFPMPLMINADKAARIIVDGIADRKAEIHFPKLFSISYKLLAALPAGLYTKIMLQTARKS